MSLTYLKSVLKDDTAQALVKWHRDHGKKADYISPRRIEMVGKVWETTGDKQSLVAAMPTGGTFDVGKLFNLLNNTALPEDLEALLDDDREKIASHIRSMGAARILDALKDAKVDHSHKALTNIAEALNTGFGPVTISEHVDVIDQMNDDMIDKMVAGWTSAKKKGIGIRQEIRDNKGTKGMAKFKELLDG